MPRPGVAAGLTLVALALISAQPGAARAQTLEGRVVDVSSGAALSAAVITVMTGGRTLFAASSDSLGRFRLVLPGPGRYALRVERAGYQPASTATFTVASRQLLALELRLGVDPVPLDPLVITARRAALAPHADYFRRLESGRRSGAGDFITREDFDAVRLPFVTSYVARVPGVMLRTTDPLTGRSTPVLRGDCVPAVYLNGVPLDVTRGPGWPGIDDYFTSDEVEGVEIYAGSHIPPEYARPDVCGVIVVWSRLPQGESRQSLWKLLIGGSLVGGLVLLSLF